ncbi:MAG: transcription elongation factor GreA [Amphritea sp.]
MQKFPMTVQGEHALRVELDDLKAVQRPTVIASIAEAREHGDLKENAEYHAAREQQGFIEGRIQELEGKLGSAQVIDVTQIPHTGKVIFGTTVEIINLDTDGTVRYQIVGEDEADIKCGKISVGSPIARALIGKEEGDVAVVQTPNGGVEYEIDQVHHI